MAHPGGQLTGYRAAEREAVRRLLLEAFGGTDLGDDRK